MKKIKVIGIDPGTCITGYGIIETDGVQYNVIDYGCIRPPTKTSLEKRYLIIYNSLCELLDLHKPSSTSIESQYMRHNFQSALKIGMARGMALLASTQRNIPIAEYSPCKAKLAVVGTGRASKVQVQAMIQKLLFLRELPQPEDAADALALAICHVQNSRISL